MQHHVAGRFSAAEEIYVEILRSDPDQPQVLHLQGLMAHQLGRNEAAVELFNKSLAIKPDFTEARNNLGIAFKELGRFNEALENYHKALKLNPNFAEAHNNLGLALQLLGRLDEAFVSYRKALAIKPDFAQAHFNLGRAFKEREHLHEAVASYQKALNINPDHAEASCELGVAFRELRRLDEAVVSFRKAVAVEPDYAWAHNNLGLTLQELGQLGEAVVCYEQALRIKPDFAAAHYNLGIVYSELGCLDDSLESYRKACMVQPDDAEVLTALTICYWGENEWEKFSNYNKILSNLNYEHVCKSSKNFLGGYGDYLESLSKFRTGNPQLYEHIDERPPLFTLGDSHCLSPAHTTVNYAGTQYFVKPKLIIGCKAWHLGNSKCNKYKAQFERIAESFKPESKVIVMFGEIDCRLDEGIIRHHRKTRNNLEKAIRKLVQSYVAYVFKILGKNRIIPIFYGVPAPNTNVIDENFPDDNALLIETIKKFNETLVAETKRMSVPLLDVYSLTNDVAGKSSGIQHIDNNIHLIPTALQNLIK